MIVDLFCGAGGWAAGLHAAGVDPDGTVGVELDTHAAATHKAAGFPTVVADVATADPHTIVEGRPVDGLIASPPCQAFSLAGHGHGRDNIAALLAHVDRCADGWVPPDGVLVADDVRADLTLQPLRWAEQLQPRWVALEQVPPVLPAWQHIAAVLSGWGYSTWTGVLSAERYGVPQTRRRAILVARRDGAVAGPPPPTHHGYDPRNPDEGRRETSDLFGGTLLPWVSMADALDAGLDDRPAPTVTSGGTDTGGAEVFADANMRRRIAYAASTMPNAAVRPTDTPAPTIAFGNDAASAGWVVQTGANTMRRQNAPGSVRVTTAQAATLQSFPHGWPWQGPKTSIYRQIGNAIPPRLATAIVTPLLDRTV